MNNYDEAIKLQQAAGFPVRPSQIEKIGWWLDEHDRQTELLQALKSLHSHSKDCVEVYFQLERNITALEAELKNKGEQP